MLEAYLDRVYSAGEQVLKTSRNCFSDAAEAAPSMTEEEARGARREADADEAGFAPPIVV